ncbi:hypothetical protein Tco_1118891, partial [Tanacetum coccineum]
MIANLCTIWIGRTFRASIPIAMNSRNTRDSFASILKEGFPKQSLTDQLKPALVLDDPCIKERDFSMSQMGLWVLIELDSQDSIEKFRNHVGVKSWLSSIKSAFNSFVSDERIVWVLIEGKVHWIRAKELDAWVPKFLSENDDSSSNDELTDLDEGFNFKDKEHKNPNDDSDVDKAS